MPKTATFNSPAELFAWATETGQLLSIAASLAPANPQVWQALTSACECFEGTHLTDLVGSSLPNFGQFVGTGHTSSVTTFAKGQPVETGSKTSVKRSSSKTTGGTDMRKIRSWAAEQGYDVADRGRIPASIISKYHESVGASA